MIVYLNDILIFTWILEDHHFVVCRVFEILARYKLFLCPEKYKFNKWQVEYLRLVISQYQIIIDPIKVTRVCNWPISYNHIDMQVFLEFTNFYHRFICNFLDIACLLFDVTSTNTSYAWNSDQQHIFIVLKTASNTALVLISPNTSTLLRSKQITQTL